MHRQIDTGTNIRRQLDICNQRVFITVIFKFNIDVIEAQGAHILQITPNQLTLGDCQSALAK